MASRAALLSGFLGATAACFAKVAFGSLPVQAHCEQYHYFSESTSAAPPVVAAPCYWIELILARGIGLGCMVACNAWQLGTFLEGMETAGSVAGTALATAANFVVSAGYGYFLWNERFSAVWWAGFGMVVAGVMLLSSTTSSISAEHSKKD